MDLCYRNFCQNKAESQQAAGRAALSSFHRNEWSKENIIYFQITNTLHFILPVFFFNDLPPIRPSNHLLLHKLTSHSNLGILHPSFGYIQTIPVRPPLVLPLKHPTSAHPLMNLRLLYFFYFCWAEKLWPWNGESSRQLKNVAFFLTKRGKKTNMTERVTEQITGNSQNKSWKFTLPQAICAYAGRFWFPCQYYFGLYVSCSVEVQKKGELKTSKLRQTSGGQVIGNDGWEAHKQTSNATSLTG